MAIGLVALTACGTAIEIEAAPSPTPEPSASAAMVSAFASVTPLDEPVDAAGLVGAHSVLWFWAPWCTICRAEAPDVLAIVQRYGDRVAFVGVAGRGEIDAMRDFIDDTGISDLTHVADLDGDVWNAFGVFAQPAFAFIDDDGEYDVFVGGLRADDLAERIDALLEE